MKLTEKNFNLLGCLFFILLTFFLALRLFIGVDFSDESYYALFLDDWLKGDITSSTLLTLHQTAAMIIYPLAFLYFKIQHSTSGLLLFLRCLFLFFNFVAAYAWVLFLKRYNFGAISWLGGIMILGFIPFGLPAPSYNTLSAQFLTIALATFGIQLACKNRSLHQLLWMLTSSIAWALATLAYPSLLAAFVFFCCLVLLFRTSILRTWLYIGLLVSASLMAWLILINYLSLNRLYQSFLYLSTINDAKGFERKFNFALLLLKQNKIFTCLLTFSILIGLLQKYLPVYIRIIGMLLIFAFLIFIPPTFFSHSHDAFTLATFMGLGLLFGLKRQADFSARVIALIYATSFVTSILICLSASNSVFNFCIGSAPAASLAVLAPPFTNHKKLNWLPAMTFIAAILSTSLFLFYGEIPTDTFQKRRLISHGFFAGIFARQSDIEILEIIKKFVSPILNRNDGIAIFARIPGIVLDTPARLKMMTSYPLVSTVSPKGLNLTHAFYTHAENRPKLVLIYQDPYFNPINPMQKDFLIWYSHLHTFSLTNGKLNVYLQKHNALN